ncbi:MAG TPA: VWA domain-containing protein, partial [Thermoanaerobaculia bacterium]|nr:VWA domain-containing protein [Thermoanaerobaculia bacterium]
MSGEDLVVQLARFAWELRERGIATGLADEVDAVAALTFVDLSDRAEVRRALLTALKIRPRDRAGFDELFARFWAAESPGETPARDPAAPGRVPPVARSAGGATTGAGAGPRASVPDGTIPGYSAEALLRRKPFDECSAADLAAMERLLERLASRLATRRSRRLVPSPARGAADLRRSFRRVVGTGGEFLTLARRTRAIEQPRLVVLCDTSGSMDSHSRFLLAFVLSLKRAARRTEIFAFNTSLVRLTPWISPQKIGPTLERLAAGVPDWSGGTRIGECLSEFVARYQDAMVDSKTVVLIFSDGL